MNETNTPAATEWSALRPLLDEAMDELNERDRELVLLRFFARRPLAEIGRAVNLTEDAVRMRVNRALDKLHALLARRGFTSSAALIAAALEVHAISLAPAGLAASVSGAAAGAAGGAMSGGILNVVWSSGMLSAASLGVAALVVAAVALHEKASAHGALNEPRLARTDARAADVEQPALGALVTVSFDPPASDPEAVRGREILAAHPELEGGRNRMFEHNWGRHLRAMHLGAAEIAGLRADALQAANWTFRVNAAGGFSYWPAARHEDASHALEKINARLFARLGAARVDAFKEAYARSAVHDFVRAAVMATYETDAPLTPGDIAELAQAVARHGRRGGLVGALIPGATSIGVHRIDWNVLERELAGRFAPEQLGILARAWQRTVAEFRENVAKQPWVTSAEKLRDDPTVQAHELETARAGLALAHGGFYRTLKLTPSQTARLESALIEHEGRVRDIRAAERGIKIDRARAETREAMTADGRRVRVLVDPSIAALRREEDARFKAELIGALGDDGYARWQEYQAGVEKRAFVAELAGRRADAHAAHGRTG